MRGRVGLVAFVEFRQLVAPNFVPEPFLLGISLMCARLVLFGSGGCGLSSGARVCRVASRGLVVLMVGVAQADR